MAGLVCCGLPTMRLRTITRVALRRSRAGGIRSGGSCRGSMPALSAPHLTKASMQFEKGGEGAMMGGCRSEIVVIDPQKLRQAGVVRLLESWAKSNELDVTAISPPQELTVGPNSAMVLLSVGGVSVLEKDPQLWIKSVRTVMQDVPLVILSDRGDCPEICAAFREGAKGFISTDIDPQVALEALTFIHRGGSFFPTSVLLETSGLEREEEEVLGRNMADAEIETQFGDNVIWRRSKERPGIEVGTPVHHPADRALTPRQQEVLEGLREGKPNKVIARDLQMTEATVKVHVRQIMRKFGATNRTQVVLCAMRFVKATSG